MLDACPQWQLEGETMHRFGQGWQLCGLRLRRLHRPTVFTLLGAEIVDTFYEFVYAAS